MKTQEQILDLAYKHKLAKRGYKDKLNADEKRVLAFVEELGVK